MLPADWQISARISHFLTIARIAEHNFSLGMTPVLRILAMIIARNPRSSFQTYALRVHTFALLANHIRFANKEFVLGWRIRFRTRFRRTTQFANMHLYSLRDCAFGLGANYSLFSSTRPQCRNSYPGRNSYTGTR
eukprot:3018531-Rhodomonas_salina.1